MSTPSAVLCSSHKRCWQWASAKQSTHARLWLVGVGLLSCASWGRWLATGSLRVDNNYPSSLVGTLLLLTLVFGWSLLVVGWRGMLLEPPSNPRSLAFAGLVVATFMLPMVSNDLFSLFAYGSQAARGQDVYTARDVVASSVWYPWVGEHWQSTVCVYGPTTLPALMPVALAGNHPWGALILIRLVWQVPLALVMELSFRALKDRPFFHAMVWLNPLFVLHGPGQLHADCVALIAMVTGIVLQTRKRRLAGWLCYCVALLSKYSFAFGGLWFWLRGAGDRRERLRRLGWMAAVLAGMAVLAFAPFWKGVATLREPIRALGAMNPGGSIVEVVGDLVQIVSGRGLPSPDLPVAQALEMNRREMGTTWFVVSLVLRIASLIIGVRVLVLALRKPHDEDRIALGAGVLTVAALTLASHRFQSWYLLAAVPFFGLACTTVWRRWWIAAVALSAAPEFIHVLPKTSALLPPWSVATTGGMIVVFLLWPKRRFWDLDGAPLTERGVSDRAYLTVPKEQ